MLHDELDRPQLIRISGGGPLPCWIRLDYDQDLQSVPTPVFDVSDWVVNNQNMTTTVVTGNINQYVVWIYVTALAPNPGPDRVSYLAIAQQVRALDDGTPADPFTDRPLPWP